MKRFLTYFLRGLVFLAPVGITAYICYVVFTTIDGWLRLPYPGVGFAISIALITLFGFLASGFLTRRMIAALDDVLERLPFVRLLYSSTRDLVSAFVGEKRRFDKPVLVQLNHDGNAHALGFVTQESLDALGMHDFVSVYLPHSYAFSGQMRLFPRSCVQRVDASSSDMMAFIVSGGVTELPQVVRPMVPLDAPAASVPAIAEGSQAPR